MTKKRFIKQLDALLLSSSLVLVIVRFILGRMGEGYWVDLSSWILVGLVIAFLINKALYLMVPRWFENKNSTLDEEEGQLENS